GGDLRAQRSDHCVPGDGTAMGIVVVVVRDRVVGVHRLVLFPVYFAGTRGPQSRDSARVVLGHGTHDLRRRIAVDGRAGDSGPMKWALLIAALLTGTVRDRRPPFEPHMRDGYMLLPVDFHVHSFPFSWSSLAPWDLVLEAPRQGLEAIAIAGHNHTWVGEVGRWVSRQIGGVFLLCRAGGPSPRGPAVAGGGGWTVA